MVVFGPRLFRRLTTTTRGWCGGPRRLLRIEPPPTLTGAAAASGKSGFRFLRVCRSGRHTKVWAGSQPPAGACGGPKVVRDDTKN